MKHTLRDGLLLIVLLASLPAAAAAFAAAPAAAQPGAAANRPSPELLIDPVLGPDRLDYGQTALYAVSVRNAGAPAASILLQIEFDAPMATGGTVLAGNGFYCLVESHQYLCDGGALASGEATTLTFDVRGSDAGRGSIHVSASADGTPDETTGTPYGVIVTAAPTAD